MLFTKAKDLYFDYCKEKGMSKKTIQLYKTHMNRMDKFFISEYNRPLYVDEVGTDELKAYIAHNFEGKKRSTSQQHVAVVTFKSFYNFCEKHKICENNPGKLIKTVEGETLKKTPVSEEEITAITQKISSATVKAVISTIYYAGMRLSECQELKLEDVDLAEGNIHVSGVRGLKRVIPINGKLKSMLQWYLEYGRYEVGSGKFFSTHSGKIGGTVFDKTLRKAVEKLKLGRKICLNDLRHSFALNMLKNGADKKLFKQVMGYSTNVPVKFYMQ